MATTLRLIPFADLAAPSFKYVLDSGRPHRAANVTGLPRTPGNNSSASHAFSSRFTTSSFVIGRGSSCRAQMSSISEFAEEAIPEFASATVHDGIANEKTIPNSRKAERLGVERRRTRGRLAPNQLNAQQSGQFGQTTHQAGADSAHRRGNASRDAWMHGKKLQNEVMAPSPTALRDAESRGKREPIAVRDKDQRNLGMGVLSDGRPKLRQAHGGGNRALVVPPAFGGESGELQGITHVRVAAKRGRGAPSADHRHVLAAPERNCHQAWLVFHQDLESHARRLAKTAAIGKSEREPAYLSWFARFVRFQP